MQFKHSATDLPSCLALQGNVPQKDLNTRPMEVFMCSVLKRQGYGEGFRWLSQYIDWYLEKQTSSWTDPVHSFLMDFSIRTWKALQPHTGNDQETPVFSYRLSQWWHNSFVWEITFCTWYRLSLPVAIVSCGNHGFQLQWGCWARMQNSAHSTLVAGKENMSHHCGQLT